MRTQRREATTSIDATTIQPERQACDAAIAWLTMAWQHDPGHQDSLVGALLHRASLLTDVALALDASPQREQVLTEVATDCRQALNVAPTDFDVLYLTAQVLLFQHQSEDASIIAERAMAAAACHPDAEAVAGAQRLLEQVSLQPLLEQATSHMRHERFTEAIPLLKQAAQRHPAVSILFFKLAQCHIGLDDPDAAEAACLQALALTESPDEIATIRELQGIAADLRQRAQAFGSVEAFRLYQQALQHSEQDNYDAAIELLRAAMAQVRPAVPAWRQLFASKTTGQAGKLEEGLAVCFHTRAMQKAQHEVERLQGRLHRAADALQRLGEAEADLREALRLDGSNATLQQDLEKVESLLRLVRSL